MPVLVRTQKFDTGMFITFTRMNYLPTISMSAYSFHMILHDFFVVLHKNVKYLSVPQNVEDFKESISYEISSSCFHTRLVP